jgi:tRNA-specific 2-thiouridylase
MFIKDYPKNKPVIVGLSGGVDSAVAAYLLKKQGFDLIGVTALNWPDSRCCHESSILVAQKLAHQLGFPHHVIDVSPVFQKEIIDHFVGSYENGLTPSPCTRCNQKIRFGLLVDTLKEKLNLSDAYFATGHYVQVSQKDDHFCVAKGIDPTKDQSYMLYALSQAQLKNYISPLGTFLKREVRQIAADANLIAAHNPDSQDICFVKDSYQNFIANYSHNEHKSGFFVNRAGKILGEHRGIAFYTVGQRRGLGIAAEKPLYVLEIDAVSRNIVLGFAEEALKSELQVQDVLWQIPPQNSELEAEVKIRYQTPEAHARLKIKPDGRVAIQFQNPVEAIAPGQAAVFYSHDYVLGGGIICV